MELLILLPSLLLFLFVIWFRKQKQRMTYFKKIGIPGPPPHFITGNMKEIDEKGLGECHRQWIEKYGKIVGYYIGSRTYVLTSDLELLKLIQIKHVTDFTDKKMIVPGGTVPIHISAESILYNRGERWKKNRSILSPTFTSGKLKQMYTIIEECVEDFLHLVKESSSDTVDIRKLFANLSLDVFGRTSFGIKTNVQFNKNSTLITDSEVAVSSKFSDISVRMLVYFPDLVPIIMNLRRFHDYLLYLLKFPSATGLVKFVADVIKARKRNKQERCDLIQLMIDSRISNEHTRKTNVGSFTATSTSIKDKETVSNENPESSWYRMTDKEIQGNSIVFLLAGRHITSTGLSSTVFLLATHQSVQENLRQELLNIVQQKGELTYVDIMNSSYMDQVVSESLRIYPPVISVVIRKSNVEFRYKEYVFPKDTSFQTAVSVLHYDPELWENPHSFKPERFSPENRVNMGLSYQPFGAGPRNCIGMRFALLEMKLTLAKLLLSYRILPTSRTNLDIECRISFTALKSEMEVRLIPLSLNKS